MGCWNSKAPRMSTAHLQDTAVSFSVVESLPVLGTGLFIVYCFVCHKLYKAKKKSNDLNSHGEEAQEKPPGL